MRAYHHHQSIRNIILLFWQSCEIQIPKCIIKQNSNKITRRPLRCAAHSQENIIHDCLPLRRRWRRHHDITHHKAEKRIVEQQQPPEQSTEVLSAAGKNYTKRHLLLLSLDFCGLSTFYRGTAPNDWLIGHSKIYYCAVNLVLIGQWIFLELPFTEWLDVSDPWQTLAP